jgi:hypothetical protein
MQHSSKVTIQTPLQCASRKSNACLLKMVQPNFSENFCNTLSTFEACRQYHSGFFPDWKFLPISPQAKNKESYSCS